ncbi:MAG: amidase family protein [Acidobacteriota bacterium]
MSSTSQPAHREFMSVVGAPGAVEVVAGDESPAITANQAEAKVVDLCFKNAVELARMIRAREISATEVMAAFLAQIKRINPQVNAICTFIGEEAAMRAAKEADERLAKDAAPGALHGLPIAVKDLVATAGIRTTQGSPIYKDFVPAEDALMVERMKAAGAIIIGKTNTPEFGAGSHTFNPVFGATRNPYDLTKSSGGSSGGAAAALACGMLPLADGSDLGGSLRNPAAFCNVVGFRTSPGRVPAYPSENVWNNLAVLGPMARTVADVALLLSVQAGPDARVPISLNDPGGIFAHPLERDFKGVRIAWSRNLGRYPIEPAINEICD